jgi:dihydroorotase
MKLLIRNGHVLDPATRTDGVTDILVEHGRIRAIDTHIKESGRTTVLNAENLVVCPGFIDLHVHLREPGFENKENIESGSKAAAHGGFTSIACMPNTSPVNDHRSVTEYIIARSKEVGLVNIFPVAAISRNLEGEFLTEMADLVEGGAVGFTDDGLCVMGADLIRKALEYSQMCDVPIIEHPEDHSISSDGVVNEGFISYKYGLRGILNAAEEVIVARDILLQERIRSKLHLTHISTAGSFDLIRNAKKKGIRVTADVTPHHLLLTEELITGYDTVYKVKPPLRTEQDRQAMVKGIKDGTIDCIATDHAPHTRDEKDKEFEFAPFGMIGMESAFSVVHDRLVRTGIIGLKRLVELLSKNPAKILNLDGRGLLKPGAHADITVVNPEQPFEIDPDSFYSKANNCPFKGWKGTGAVEYTIVGGKIVYRRGHGVPPKI